MSITRRWCTELVSEELPKRCLIGKSQLVGDLLHRQIRTVEQPSRLCYQHVCNVLIHRTSRYLAHDTRQISRRHIQLRGVKLYIVLFQTIIDQQLSELAVDLYRMRHLRCVRRTSYPKYLYPPSSWIQRPHRTAAQYRIPCASPLRKTYREPCTSLYHLILLPTKITNFSYIPHTSLPKTNAPELPVGPSESVLCQ